MPTCDVFRALIGDLHVGAFCKLNRNERGDVDDGERFSSDEWIVSELPVEQREESSQGLLTAINRGGYLRNASRHAGETAVLEQWQGVSNHLRSRHVAHELDASIPHFHDRLVYRIRPP